MVVDGAEFGTTANIYVWGSPADVVAKPGKIWGRDSNRRRFDRIASFEKAPIAGKSGGGGNRTRARFPPTRVRRVRSSPARRRSAPGTARLPLGRSPPARRPRNAP